MEVAFTCSHCNNLNFNEKVSREEIVDPNAAIHLMVVEELDGKICTCFECGEKTRLTRVDEEVMVKGMEKRAFFLIEEKVQEGEL